MSRDILTDTTEKITGFYYKVRFSYLQSRTVDDLKNTGVVVTGIKEIDKDIENQLITSYLTIDQMVKYFQNGVSIRVVSQSDVKLIYEAIDNYLEAWKAQLTYGVNIGGAPFEYLMAMDRFANSVYEHAKYHFTEDNISSIMARHLSEISGLNGQNFFRQAPVVTNNTTKTEEDDGRQSLSDFLESRMINFRQPR